MQRASLDGCTRRQWLGASAAAGVVAATVTPQRLAADSALGARRDLRIKEVRITPIALPDPPLLASSGCHGPYFLRNIVELLTDDGIVGIGETKGGEEVTGALRQAAAIVQGKSVFAYHACSQSVRQLANSAFAGIELACLDAIGRAMGRRVCELLGGPVRERVEFAAYMFYRYAADHRAVLSDPRRVAAGKSPIDAWGEARSPETMAELARQFQKRFGFRVFKLKAGVLDPDRELETLRAMNHMLRGQCPLRIDPNARWTTGTAVRIGSQLRDLPLEYYEDPVEGQVAMAEVRRQTGLKMSTNMCVTRFDHIPEAITTQPIDVVLGDHHGWGGLTAFQSLGLLTESLGWGLSQHSNNHGGITMAAMIHAGAITPQLTWASDTHYVWLPPGADIIVGDNLPIVDGHMTVPAGVGLGVELDRDRLAQAHEVYRKCGMRERDDGATMQRFEVGWQRRLF